MMVSEKDEIVGDLNEAGASLSTVWTKPLVFLCLYLATLLTVYHQSIMSMVGIWQRSDTFAHGFFIPLISLWLIWRQRHSLASERPQMAMVWILPLVASCCVWLLGVLANALVVEQLGVVLILIFGVVFIVGQSIGRRLAFPLLFLLLMVPMGEELIEPMMELTATSTVWLVRWFGIPVYREGLYFSLPSGNWSVVEACSGVRYLIASFALGTLYAYITYKSFYKRSLFVVFSILVPVIANSLRAFMIVMIGHYSDMKHAVGVDHLIYGWAFFGVVIFLMFWVGNFFADEMSTDSSSAPTHRSTESASHGASPAPVITTVLFPLVLFAVIALTRQTPNWLLPEQLETHHWQLNYAKIDAEQLSSEQWSPGWSPRPVAPDFSKKSQFSIEQIPITFYQYHYLKRRDGGELVNSLDRWQGDAEGSWRILDKGYNEVSIDGKVRSVEYAILSNGFGSQLVWRWYRIDNYFSSDPYGTKVRQILAILDPSVRLSGRYYLAASFQESPEKAQALLADFVTQLPIADATLVEASL